VISLFYTNGRRRAHILSLSMNGETEQSVEQLASRTVQHDTFNPSDFRIDLDSGMFSHKESPFAKNIRGVTQEERCSALPPHGISIYSFSILKYAKIGNGV
jgi:hypothetical protein